MTSLRFFRGALLAVAAGAGAIGMAGGASTVKPEATPPAA